MERLKVDAIIPKVLSSIETEVAEKFSSLPDSAKALKLKEVSKDIKEKLIGYLKSGEGKEEIVSLFLKEDIPYPIAQKFLEAVKVKVLERIVIESDFTGSELEEVKEKFKELEHAVAKFYLQRDIKELRDRRNFRFKKYALFKAHSRYIDRIIEAIESNDLSRFPLESYADSEFKKSIQYPESIMACMNAYLCDYLESLEKSVFRAAKAFFILIRKNNYPEAYLAFKELKELALKVSQKLTELYFLAFTNGESNFMKLVEYLSKIYPERFVAAIDFADLKGLNELLSEAKVNKMLERVERELHDFFQPRVDKFLVVRGISHNFFILGVKVSKEEFEEQLRLASSQILKMLMNENLPSTCFRVFGFLMDQRFNGYESRLNNFLRYIKEEAKREGRDFLLLADGEELEKLLSWQKEQFRKISFIREKISGGDIELVFQPIVRSDDFQIEALETLFRLKEGETLIPPGIFIDMIYELNLMTEVDKTVLRKLLEQRDLIRTVAKKLFINVSPQSLGSREYLERLDEFMSEMDDFSIYLEITEQRLLENACELKNLSRKYPNLKFAIDDFGSGYSSFKLVIDLAENKTLEILKLDGSYTEKVAQSPFTRKVIRAISSLSRSLGIKTVAEFVEELEVAQILREEGIDFLQGYFISKPKTVEEIIYEVEQVSSLI